MIIECDAFEVYSAAKQKRADLLSGVYVECDYADPCAELDKIIQLSHYAWETGNTSYITYSEAVLLGFIPV